MNPCTRCNGSGTEPQPEQAPAAEASRQACEGFRWVGQSFAHCDRCGFPYWEHTHDEKFAGTTGAHRTPVFERHPITAGDAAACKQKWGRP